MLCNRGTSHTCILKYDWWLFWKITPSHTRNSKPLFWIKKMTTIHRSKSGMQTIPLNETSSLPLKYSIIFYATLMIWNARCFDLMRDWLGKPEMIVVIPYNWNFFSCIANKCLSYFPNIYRTKNCSREKIR